MDISIEPLPSCILFDSFGGSYSELDISIEPLPNSILLVSFGGSYSELDISIELLKINESLFPNGISTAEFVKLLMISEKQRKHSEEKL